MFVDVGNKSLGLEALMNYLGYNPSEVGMPGSLRCTTAQYCCWQARPLAVLIPGLPLPP